MKTSKRTNNKHKQERTQTNNENERRKLKKRDSNMMTNYEQQ